jgi:hypothetical protein
MAEEQRTRVVIETSFEGKGLVDARVAVDKLADSQKKQTKASKEAATGLKDEATAADDLSQSTVGAKKAADALTDASKKQNKALVETTSVVESTATAVDRLGEKTDATAVKQRRASKVTASTAKGTKASGLAFQDAAELAERMRAALGPLGDVLGDVTGGADDVGTALKGFTGTQVAVAAGTVALVAGMVKFGGAVLDVLVNLDQYEDQVARLRGQGIIDDAQVESLRMANTAIKELSSQFSGLFILVATKVAPAVENFARGTVAVLGFVQGGWEGMVNAVRDFQVALRDADSQSVATGSASASAAEQIAEGFQKAADQIALADLGFDDKLQDLLEYGRAADEVTGSIAISFAEVDAKVKQSAQEMAQAVQGTLAPVGGAVLNLAGNISELYNEVTDNQIGALRRGSAEQKKALQKQFKTNKAFAVAQAAIQGGLAFIQALAGSPFPTNFIVAGVVAAATAVQIGLIASRKFSAHTGWVGKSAHRGLAGDETMTTFGGQELRVRNNEVPAVLTRQGAQAALEDSVATWNRGQSAARGSGDTVIMVGMKTVERVQALGRVHPGVGQRRR